MTAACLHTNQTDVVRNQIIEKIKNNEIAVLLVSPEAMVSNNSPLNRAMVKDFPPIAFACIDEVHCVSQWSHNFRTSYLLICKVGILSSIPLPFALFNIDHFTDSKRTFQHQHFARINSYGYQEYSILYKRSPGHRRRRRNNSR